MPETLMLVGSLNREIPGFDGARGAGLSVFAFDPGSGAAHPVCEERGIDNPTFLCVDPATRCVYATTEVPGWHEGTVTAYRFDAVERRLVYIDKQPSLGSVTSHCSLDLGARALLVSNYGGFPEGEGPDRAVAVLPLRADGGLGAPTWSVAHRGRGAHPARQDRPHPHCVLPSPDGRFVVVCDLGLDAILTYRRGRDGMPSPEAAVTRLRPGSGPRHIAFHPGGRFAVVICELDSTVSSLCYDPGSGRLDVIATVPALPGGHGPSRASDVQIHPNGRWVFGANRGHDSVAVLAMDPDTGSLTPAGHHPCGGRTPRHLALDPSGRHLVVANQDSDALSVFALDATGAPSGLPRHIPVGTPMCVRFMALD